MKYLYIFIGLGIIILYTNCSQQKLSDRNISNLLTFLNIDDSSHILQAHDIINEKLISYDSIKKEISLLELTNYQKSVSIGKILPDTYPPYSAYLVGIQEQVPDVFTVIIYINTDYIAPMYLINYKDTVFVDYIYHEGSYVYDVVEDTNNKENIFSYQRWFEFHQDTVYEIENNIRSDYYSDTGKQIERNKDSLIVKYKVEENGMFKKVYYDSIPYLAKSHKDSKASVLKKH